MSDAQPVQPGLFTDEGLIGGACGACRRRHFPLATICPWCGCADEVTEVTLSSHGTLRGWTAVNAPPPGYEGPVPYGFGIVELPADGLQVVTRLVESDPSLLAAGIAMRFRVVPLTTATVTWAFERA